MRAPKVVFSAVGLLVLSDAVVAQDSGGLQTATTSVKSTRLISQFLSDPGPLMSANAITHLTGEPTIKEYERFLGNFLSERGPEFERQRQPSTANFSRVHLSGGQSLILRELPYWEYVIIDAFLAQTRTRVPIGYCPSAEDSIFPPIPFDQASSGSRLEDVQCLTVAQYEFVIVVTGKFKAGGRPTSIEGYDDMLTGGFAAELEFFAGELTEGFASHMHQVVDACWEARTGIPYSRGRRCGNR